MSLPDKSIDPRLLSAAKEEFLNKGFEKASLTDICKAAGVTTGALYKRFNGKEDLFSALVSDMVREMTEYLSGLEKVDLTGLTDRELYDLSHNHHFKWWFVKALIRAGYCSPQRAVSQALLLVRLQSGTSRVFFSRLFCLLSNIFSYRFFCHITNCSNVISSCPERLIPFAL